MSLCRCTTNDNCLNKGTVNQPDFSMAAIESIKSANFKLSVIISNNGRRRRTATRRRKITDQHPAFATALYTGQQLGHVRFTQGSMRKHLYKCITLNGRLTMFPAKPRKCRGVISTDILELYCSCRMPEIILMVMCTKNGTTMNVCVYQKLH